MISANQLLQHLTSPQTPESKASHDPKPEATSLPVVAPGAAFWEFSHRVNPNCYGDAHENPHDSTAAPEDLAHTFKISALPVF